MIEESAASTLDEAILQITREQKPATIERLIELVRQEYKTASTHEILETVSRLHDLGKLGLDVPRSATTGTLSYLRTTSAAWYWSILAVTFAAVISVFAIPEDTYPFIFIRYAFAAIYILYLPGYTFIKALFPKELPIEPSDKSLEIIARTVLSSGMSLALVPLVGLLLNYTQWGITLTPITVSLTVLTLTFATIALLRENENKPK